MGLSDNERTSAIARQIESALHNKQPGEVRACRVALRVLEVTGWSAAHGLA